MRTRSWRVGLVVMAVAVSAACREAEPLSSPQPMAAAGGGAGTTPAAAGTGAPPSAAAGPYLGAAGIGVADLDKSFDFYTNVVGMSLRYDLPVPGYVNEKVLYFKDSKGSDVVLMNYIDGRPRNYLNNPVKIVFYVPSASALIEKMQSCRLGVFMGLYA